MKAIITIIQTVITLLEQVITSVVGMVEATVAGGTIFATLAQILVPGFSLWFVAAMLALPVVIIIINVFRDFL